MVVYNLTLQVEPAIEEAWKEWELEEHIPDIMKTGQFTEFRFYKLIDPPAEEHITYVTQFYAESIGNYHTYISDFAPVLRKKALDKWGNQFFGIRTVMELVN